MAIRAGTLEVHLERASDLQIGTFRIGSPYVVLFCGQSQQVTSRTAEGQGSQPVFNEIHKFRVDETTPELLIWMYNKRTFKEPDELGWIRIPLGNLFQGNGITRRPSNSFAITSRSSGRHSGNLTLTLTHTPHSFQQGPSRTSYGAQQAHPSQRAFTPSFRSDQGRRSEAELREIAAHATEIPALDWVKLYAKLELADSIRLEELISPEDQKKVEEESRKIPPLDLQKLLMEFATQSPGDLARLQAVQKYEEAKKRPVAAPKASYVPSFRSDQGRRPEAELVEIAANRFNIGPLDWFRLMVKLDFEDVRRLEDEFISPEDLAKMEAIRRSQMTLQAMQQLMKEFTPADMARMQVLTEYSQGMQNVQAEAQAQRNKVSQMRVEMSNAAIRRAAASCDFMGTIGNGSSYEYKVKYYD